MRRSSVVSLAVQVAVSFAIACSGAPVHSAPARPSSPSAGGGGPSPSPAVAPRPLMTVDEARQYLLTLINRDRASMGLAPVGLDEGPGERAGQSHADDMAENAYLGHWGLDGSVPEARLTAAGGADMVLENASCFVDEAHRRLDHTPRIDPDRIEKTEEMFFHEQPPNDGHRKNILKPWHTRVGIGIAQPRATATEIPVPCVTEEFLDSYGTYAAIPRDARVGARIRVEGEISGVARIAGVGLARVDTPHPITTSDANARRSYPVPSPYATYWPAGFVTPIPLTVKGNHFAIDLPLDDHGKPGMYELSVWAKLPQSSDFQMVSLRTIRVAPKEE